MASGFIGDIERLEAERDRLAAALRELVRHHRHDQCALAGFGSPPCSAAQTAQDVADGR